MIRNCLTVIYADNLEYDLNNVFAMSDATLTRMYVGSRLLYATFLDIEFRDAAFLENPPISVRRMGIQINLPKLGMPTAIAKSKPTQEVIDYCSRDSEIVLRWVSQVMADFSAIGVKLRRTLPSTALNYFKSIHGQIAADPKMIVRDNQLLRDFVRRGYFGGRTEVFRLGPVRGIIHHADVSSMYPSVMVDNLYPSPDTSEYVEGKDCDIHSPGAFYCKIHGPPMRFPVLPLRHDTWTIFPCGSFSGVWTCPELAEAERQGYDIQPIYGVNYSTTYRPFESTIGVLYDMKLHGHSRAKFIMNSLYGKFGESGSLMEVIGSQVRMIESEPKHANVIWAAYVTAYARLKLLAGFMRIERKGGEVLYCDTDSAFYLAPTIIMDDGSKLGGWEHKGTETMFEAKSPKVYRFGDVFRGKGVPMAHAKSYFLHGAAQFDKPNRFRESLARGLVVNKWERQTRETLFTYVKRLRQPDDSTIALTLPIEEKQNAKRKSARKKANRTNRKRR